MFHVKQSGKAVTNKCSSTIWNRMVTWLFTNTCIVASVTISRMEKSNPGRNCRRNARWQRSWASARSPSRPHTTSLSTKARSARANAAATTHATSRPLPRSRSRETFGSEPRQKRAQTADARIVSQTRTVRSLFPKMKSVWKDEPDIVHPTLTSPRRSMALHPTLETPRPMRRCSQTSRTARWQPPCSPTPLGRKPSAERFRMNRRHRWPKPLPQQGRPNCEAPSPIICGSIAGWTCRPIRSS